MAVFNGFSGKFFMIQNIYVNLNPVNTGKRFVIEVNFKANRKSIVSSFSSNLQYAKLQNFLPIRINHSAPSGNTKTSKFLPYNFSQYNFEKLIRTLVHLASTTIHDYLGLPQLGLTCTYIYSR